MKHFYRKIDKYFVGMIIGVVLQIIAFFVIGNIGQGHDVWWHGVDDAIPFVVPFVIPYSLWFAYIAVGLISFWIFHLKSEEDHREFVRTMWMMGLGLLLCAIFYLIYPTKVPDGVRPNLEGQTGLSNFLMRFIYNANVANNALPSEHCYVSMVLCLGFLRAPVLRRSRHRFWVYPASILMSVSIFAATVFTKQHSILDFFAALALFIVLYVIVYCIPWRKRAKKNA